LRHQTAIAAAALLLASGTATGASTPDAPSASVRAESIYCVVQDGGAKQAFYSGVFAGDYSDSQSYQQSFLAYVDARYGDTSAGTVSLCFYEDTAQEAMDAGNYKAASDRRNGYNVVWTRWTA
jgi:hypothetical protein